MRANTLDTLSLFTAAGHRKYLTSDERRRFFDAASRSSRSEVQTLCAVLAYTGCRISEALELTASSFHMADGFVVILSLKKRSKVPIPGSASMRRSLSSPMAIIRANRCWLPTPSPSTPSPKRRGLGAGVRAEGRQLPPRAAPGRLCIHAVRRADILPCQQAGRRSRQRTGPGGAQRVRRSVGPARAILHHAADPDARQPDATDDAVGGVGRAGMALSSPPGEKVVRRTG